MHRQTILVKGVRESNCYVRRISPLGKEEMKMAGRHSNKREAIEDVVVIVGLVVVQFLYAGNSILLSYLLKLGFRPSFLIICSTFATSVVLSPLAVFFERTQWPKRMSYRLCVELLLLSFGGVTLFQSLVMKGVSLTSPAMATAMPNLAPGLIFCMSWAFRLERIELACRYSRAKIVGTVLCVFGAVVLSLMQSTVRDDEFDDSFPSTPRPHVFFDKQTMLGCVYLIASVVVFSSQVVLQAITLRDFPAPMSLCALTSVIGVLITVVVEMVEDQGWNPGSLTIQEMIAYSILAGSVSGMCVSFNSWAMKKRGPVIVSIFNPLATVISAIFSILTFGESISVGSLAGMCLMFTGLYFVLWGKRKEGLLMSNDNNNDLQTKYDMEKPLLS